MAALDVLVGRQPIFDANHGVVAYELLFRSLEGVDASDWDGDALTSSVVFGAAAIGVDRLVGDKLAFVNADHGLVTGAVPMLLPPERTVIEVLETVTPTDAVLAGCHRLRARGYRLALDDFTWSDGAERLLEVASIVKIDIQEVPPRDLAALTARCRDFGATLLAEKVETGDELARCRRLGFDLFQGFVLARPQIVSGRTLDGSSVTRLELAAALVSDEFDLDELERIVRTDPALGLQLLQLASVGTDRGMRRTVRTLREALVLLGSRQLQTWLAFLILMQRGGSSTDQAAVALHRARMCELLGREVEPVPGMAFTAGLLSALDLLMDVPVDDVLRSLPLADELIEAALGRGDGLGSVVQSVMEYQFGAAPEAVSPREMDRASTVALTWCARTLDAVTGHSTE